MMQACYAFMDFLIRRVRRFKKVVNVYLQEWYVSLKLIKVMNIHKALIGGTMGNEMTVQ